MTRKRAGQLAGTLRSSRRGLLPRYWRSELVDRRPKFRLSRFEDVEQRAMLVATIEGVKFNDLGGDGLGGPLGDVRLGGVDIQLIADTNGNGTFEDGVDVVSETTTTDGNGDYQFTDVLPGRYFIREVTPTGTTQTAPGAPGYYTVDVVGDFVLPAGVAPIVIDEFDLPTPADSFFIDFDDPDPFLLEQIDAGALGGERDLFVDVVGTPAFNSANGTIGTGIFNFGTDNPSASAVLQYDGVDADVIGPPAALDRNQFATPVDLTTGGINAVRIDFNNVDGGGVGLNALEYEIRIFDSNGNEATFANDIGPSTGFISAFAPFSAFTTTLPNFDFSSVTAIEVELNPNAVVAVDFEIERIVTARVQNTDFNFANALDAVLLSSLSGFVYHDADNDGVMDVGEAGIGGVTVELRDAANALVQSTTTTAAGLYIFNGIAAGTYSIVETQPATHFDGIDTPGTINGVTEGVATPPDSITSIDIGPTQAGIDYNFGELLGATLSGFVYNDADNDGVFDLGEAPIQGVIVTLSGTDDLGTAIPAGTTATTNALGRYTFTNLRPSDQDGYTVTETQPAGFLDGIDTAGTVDGVAVGTAGNDIITGIVLDFNDEGINYNFGEILVAQLSGFVYHDQDNDGTKDAGEPGIGGVTVTLTGNDDRNQPVNLTTTSDAVTGAYTFANLRPSDQAGYTVTETTQPAGFADGIDTAGTVGGVTVGTAGNDTITGIDLDPGDAGIDYNFGEIVTTVPLATISGFVYVDADNDGIKDAGEAGIPGVTVAISGGPSTPGPVVTDANGAYSFIDLQAGVYTLTETQPATFLDGIDTPGTINGVTEGTATPPDSITNIEIAGGEAGINYNFGEIVASSIAGFVYVDADNDGIKDAGEIGIGTVTVTLTGTNDLGAIAPIIVTTDASGAYSFDNLRPGTYTVTETQPATFLDGKDTAGSTGGSAAVNDVISGIVLGQDVDSINNNFGELNPASIAGAVYVDADNDGVRDAGEVGISGVIVTLSGTNDLGALPAGTTATTNASGDYVFNNLRPGTYTVTETQPATFLDGKDTAGTSGGSAAVNDVISGIVLDQDEDSTGNNFGELNPASIAGVVYVDADNDGIRDAGEAGIPNVTVTLTGTNDLGAIPAGTTATTNANGDYVFNNLRPGTYTVTETQPATFLDGKDTAGTSGGSAAVNDVISGIVLDQDEDSTGNNFGELNPATIAGSVYVDTDNDGVRDAGEVGIQSVIITLTGTNDLGVAIPAGTTATTNANGDYVFNNLRPGTYTVTEAQPATFLDGKDTAGTAGGSTAVNDVISGIVLAQDVDSTGNNFGELNFSSIAGFVYQDADNDGIKDAGESGISTVTVTLTGTNDLGAAVNQTTTTDATGAYAFNNLRPGTYNVTETQPAAFLDGKDTPGTVNNVTEGVATPPDSITSIDLGPGQSGINYNFGELLAASLSGFVYADVNANGVKDGVEAGIPGVTVTLTGTNDLGQAVNTTVTTGANGSYSFANLRPTSGAGYTITETHPISFIDGTDSIGTQGGTVGNDVLSNITLSQGVNGTNNNFGELGLIGQLVSKKPYITPSPLQNFVLPTDVNNDLATNALDALIVINALNAPGGTQLPAGTTINEFFMDVNGDTFLTPLDALMIINMINDAGRTVTPSNGGAGGQGNQALQAQNMTADEAFALAVDQALSQMEEDEEEDALNPFAMH